MEDEASLVVLAAHKRMGDQMCVQHHDGSWFFAEITAERQVRVSSVRVRVGVGVGLGLCLCLALASASASAVGSGVGVAVVGDDLRWGLGSACGLGIGFVLWFGMDLGLSH